jgi:dimeric dUTPase (all-alpha-NTP-PPase superfamily)
MENSSSPSNCGLSRIFELQADFDASVGLYHADLGFGITNYDTRTDYACQVVPMLTKAAGQELAELNDSIPWKWWKKQVPDLQNAKVEVVDLFHFVTAMALALGMTSEDLLHCYEEKMKVNIERQKKGYGINLDAEGGSTDCKHIGVKPKHTQPELPNLVPLDAPTAP